jgi:hypothetical protein
MGGGALPGEVLFSGPSEDDQWVVLVRNPNGLPTLYSADLICAAVK